ncbi:hypothetical protein N9D95_01025 [Flavobacteriales bacterium]|nr:hypothetical protein [Flavobacteriales bacterium]
MKERQLLRFSVLMFWTLFWGLSVVDKIIPDVQHLWVGKDFFALFVKFFGSLGLKDPLFATVALAGVSGLEVLNFMCYVLAMVGFAKGDDQRTEAWFFRGAFASMSLFALFSIADQVFGDRFQLLEHGLFWLVLLASWVVFRFFSPEKNRPIALRGTPGWAGALVVGTALTVATSWSILDFSSETFAQVELPVEGQEVVEGVWKFDFPFLADKIVWEATVNAFVEAHPELDVTYIYTGPSELNSKKKTHLLLYVFTEER